MNKIKASEAYSGGRLLDVVEHAHIAAAKRLRDKGRVRRQHCESKEHECSYQNGSVWAIAAEDLEKMPHSVLCLLQLLTENLNLKNTGFFFFTRDKSKSRTF